MTPTPDSPAAPDAGGETQDPGAGSPQPSTPPAPPTPSAPTTPQGTFTADNPDPEKFVPKSQLDQEIKRRQGLDRRLSQLRGRGSQQPGSSEDNLSDEDRVAQENEELRLFKAEQQLKEAASEILENYPEFPKELAAAIRKNPRGFIQSTTQTVEDAIIDLEEYISEVWEARKNEGENAPEGKPVTVASPNASTTTPGKPDIGSMTQEQLDRALDKGELELSDLEDWMKANKQS